MSITPRRPNLGCTARLAALALGAALLLAGAAHAQGAAQGAALADPLFNASFTGLDGKPASLAALRGRPLLVNFWARWCVPCREEIPRLRAAAHRGRSGAPTIVGVALEEDAAAVREFATANHMDYRIVLAGGEGVELLRALGNAQALLPYSIAVDPVGTIVAWRFGVLSDEALDASLRLAAAEESIDAAVEKLGRLTGLALACAASQAQQQAKTLMLSYATKTRELGQRYELATHAGYLEQVHGSAPCPGPQELLRRTEEAGAGLRRAAAPASGEGRRAEEVTAPGPAASTDEGIDARYLLSDERGRAVTDEDFHGRFQLITFGYTACPDVCPTTLAMMGAVLKSLGALAARVQPLFISLDPQRDTPETLRDYLASFDPRIRGLSGTAELTQAVAERFHVSYRRTAGTGTSSGSYGIEHSTGFYLLGPQGEFRERLAFDLPLTELVRRLRSQVAPEG